MGNHFAPLLLRETWWGETGRVTRVVGVAGVMVSIVAFQAVDPGSIPGPRSLFEESE